MAEQAQTLGVTNLIEVLLIVHANMMIVRRDILGSDDEQKAHRTSAEGNDHSEEDEEELDLGKTGENLW